jgi:hypothetical protein
MLARRPARIEKQGDLWVARLEHVKGLPDAPPMRLLPNSRLALLDTILSETGEKPRFAVTGRVTEFQGANYLLLISLGQLAQRPEPVAPAPEPAPSVRPETGTRPSGQEPTAEEIIRQLMENKPLRPLTPETQPAGRGEQPETDLAKQEEGARWREDTLLSDRQARLIPSGSGWMLSFEDWGKYPADPPVRVLPGRLLETAISLSAGGTRSVVFLVSGEITAYKGSNYILLRKVLVRRNMGNLR